MTHKSATIDYFKKHKRGLTTMTMMDKLGIASPTKVISNLRKDGYKILGTKCETVNRYGKKVRFVRYTLIEGDKK